MAAKILKITDKEGNEYTLQYNRRSIETMERQGFRVSDLAAYPMTMFPTLFKGAFLMHQRMISSKKVDDLFDAIPDKDRLLEKLAEMYNEPLEALMAGAEDDEGNAPTWEANW